MKFNFNEASFLGLRVTIGTIFIVHGIGKFNAGFAEFLPKLGLPPEMQIPIALAELIGGILLISGIFTRISASVLSIIMLGAIFLVKGAESITGQRGVELDLILLASLLVIIVAPQSRLTISRFIKKLPKYLQ